MSYLKYVFTYMLLIVFLTSVGIGFYYMYKDGYSLSLTALVALYSINALSTIIIFVQSRNSAAKLSWIVIVAIIPILGHIVFAIFGQRYKNRQDVKEYHNRENFKYEQYDENNNLPEDVKSIFAKQQNFSKRGIYNGEMEIFRTGDKGYQELFNDLEKAKSFIHLHYYIIKYGEIYEEFKNILIKKAHEGVEIRLIVDDFGRWALPWYEIKYLSSHGIRVEIFGRVHFPFIGSENGFRTHRKLAIIDGKIAHTGGLNIADEYANLSKKYGLWIDFQSRITGKAVRSYSLLFIEDWYQLTGERLFGLDYLQEDSHGESALILIEDSPEINEPLIQNTLVHLISNAKKSISITTPYFIPTVEIFAALKTACLSGVEVNIYIPGRADKKTVLIATRYYVDKLQHFGANIYEANDMLIHSKIGLFDSSYAYLGSVNLDNRSLYSQFELMTLATGKAIKDVEKLFDYYLSLSTKVEKGKYHTNPIKNRILRFYVNLLSPIM